MSKWLCVTTIVMMLCFSISLLSLPSEFRGGILTKIDQARIDASKVDAQIEAIGKHLESIEKTHKEIERQFKIIHTMLRALE